MKILGNAINLNLRGTDWEVSLCVYMCIVKLIWWDGHFETVLEQKEGETWQINRSERSYKFKRMECQGDGMVSTSRLSLHILG